MWILSILTLSLNLADVSREFRLQIIHTLVETNRFECGLPKQTRRTETPAIAARRFFLRTAQFGRERRRRL